jgi:hypothetical protein
VNGKTEQGAPKKNSALFQWRQAVCQSDLPPTARHVALTMSMYMKVGGTSAFPGGSRLARETGLALRTIRGQLTILVATGWLEEKYRGGSPAGGVRKATEYAAQIPSTGAGGSLVQVDHRCSSEHGPVHLATLTGAAVAPQDVKKTSEKASDSEDSFETDFESLWKHYPHRTVKKAALRSYVARRRAGADPQELLIATRHFATAMAGTEQTYIMRGSRFFGRDDPWLDYINPPIDTPGDLATAWTEPDDIPRFH